MKGELRFGPDVEWLDLAQQETDADVWSDQLSVSEERLDSVYEAVRSYLPGVTREGFAVDCEFIFRD